MRATEPDACLPRYIELMTYQTRLMTIPNLVAILNAQPQSRWTDLIGEGIGTLARELVEKAAPVPDLVQWFGEWARDVRGEQRGLLLMTAHRAKGLEFDHGAILNSGWDRPSRGEDADDPRALNPDRADRRTARLHAAR